MVSQLRLVYRLLLVMIFVTCFLESSEQPKSPSDGLKLGYQLVSQYNTPKGFTVVYQLCPENFPRNVPLKLMVEMLDGSKEIIENLLINEKGSLIKIGDTRQFLVSRSNIAQGESTRYTLSNENGSRKIGVTIVPLPIEVKDVFGHRVSMELLSPDGTLFLCHGEGFLPSEKVTLISKSGKEVTSNVLVASSDGKFVNMMAPAVLKQTSGEASIEVIGKTTKLKLQYKWGRPATVPCVLPANDKLT